MEALVLADIVAVEVVLLSFPSRIKDEHNWFIRDGVIPLWFAAPYVAMIAYYFIGETTKRGIDRCFFIDMAYL